MPDETGIKKFLDRSVDALLPLLAVPIALLIGAIILLVMDVNPLKAYSVLIVGAFGDVSGITQTLVKATPLLLVGLGVTIAFRGGVINIGGEGQLVVGALATTALALELKTWPGWALIPLSLLAGAAAGAIWGGIPGVLRSRLGVNEILSTVMMNAIAAQLANFLLRGPMMDPFQREAGTFLPESARIPQQAWLLRLIPQTSLHAGLFIALVLAVLVYIFLWRTSTGYRIRAVGLNPAASRYAGINVPFYETLDLFGSVEYAVRRQAEPVAVKPGMSLRGEFPLDVPANLIDEIDLQEWFAADEVPDDRLLGEEIPVLHDVVYRPPGHVEAHPVPRVLSHQVTITAAELTVFRHHKCHCFRD